VGRDARLRAARILPALLRSRLSGLRIAVDVQHLYRPWPHAKDQGATFFLPGGIHLHETAATTLYAHSLIAWLRARGAEVLTNDPPRKILLGPYERREREAAAWGAHAYVACHVNADGGRYALVEAVNGTAGVELAHAIAPAVAKGLPEISVGQVKRLSNRERGSVCVRFFPPDRAAVIVEPFFGDTPRHQVLFQAPRLIEVGEAIGDGVAAWWEARP